MQTVTLTTVESAKIILDRSDIIADNVAGSGTSLTVGSETNKTLRLLRQRKQSITPSLSHMSSCTSLSPPFDAFKRLNPGEKIELIETKTESGEDAIYHVVNILRLIYRAAAKINSAIRCQFERRLDCKYAHVSIHSLTITRDPDPTAHGDE